MAYQGINLGDIVAQAGAIKGQQQRSQLADMQIQQAQSDQAQQQGIDTAAANPNASLADYAKVGGLQGVKAYGEVQQTQAAADQLTYKKLLAASTSIAADDNPVAAAHQYAPDFVAHYEQQNGPGSFDKLSPQAVKQMAAQVSAHALQVLVDPTTQFKEAGDNARNANTQAHEDTRASLSRQAEDARAAASRGVQLQGQKVTMRGQDLTNADRGIPAGYERDPDKPGALRPIAGGPHDPNATSAGMDSRSSVMFNRVAASANEAVTALKNISELPVTTSTGWFGGAQTAPTLMGSVKSALAQKITSQEAQDYKTMIAGVSRSLSTIETAGLAPNGSITHSMDSITLNEGDSQLTKLRKLAETRQIIEKGIEPNLSNPKLAPAQRQLIEKIVSDVQAAIPFTQHDITKLQQSKNPNATLLDFAKTTGLPSAQPSAPAAHPAAIQSLLDKYQ